MPELRPEEPNPTYDPEADAAYATVRSGQVAYTEEINDCLNVDYDDQGRVLGVEWLWVSHTIDPRPQFLITQVSGAISLPSFVSR